MRRADPHRALRRALTVLYPELEIVAGQTEPWVSATFTGARHVLTCHCHDVDGIEEAEFSLPGHFAADITARRDDGRLIIEALTIEAD